MKILAHRGQWKQEEEKNTIYSFQRAFESGFGIETDIRDYEGELVISHNVADFECGKANNLFELYKTIGNNLPLALNVKADGIQDLLEAQLKKYGIDNYFVFDMSIPEMVVYNDRNFSFFTRNSDIEQECVLYENAKGVWVDAFYRDWDIESAIKNHLKNGKTVTLISPEIHKKSKEKTWEMLKNTEIAKAEKFYLCTDLPEEAKAYFD